MRYKVLNSVGVTSLHLESTSLWERVTPTGLRLAMPLITTDRTSLRDCPDPASYLIELNKCPNSSAVICHRQSSPFGECPQQITKSGDKSPHSKAAVLLRAAPQLH